MPAPPLFYSFYSSEIQRHCRLQGESSLLTYLQTYQMNNCLNKINPTDIDGVLKLNIWINPHTFVPFRKGVVRVAMLQNFQHLFAKGAKESV